MQRVVDWVEADSSSAFLAGSLLLFVTTVLQLRREVRRLEMNIYGGN